MLPRVMTKKDLRAVDTDTLRPGPDPLALKRAPEDVRKAETHVRGILSYLGENPDREGLLETPARVVRAWVMLGEGKASEADQTLKALRDRGASPSRFPPRSGPLAARPSRSSP